MLTRFVAFPLAARVDRGETLAVTQSIAAAAVARDDDEAVAEYEDRVGASETDGAGVWSGKRRRHHSGGGGGAMDRGRRANGPQVGRR